MNEIGQSPHSEGAMSAILCALTACYGDLASPDFRKVYEQIDGPVHRRIIDELRANGASVKDTTDQNDDVATHLIESQGSDEVGLALSGVGHSHRSST